MRTTLRILLAGAVGLTAACQDSSEPTGLQGESLQTVAAPAGNLVAGQYIVVFRDGVADAPGLARRLAQAHGTTPTYTYQHAIKGFAARLPEQAVEALRRNPNVAYVEPDQVMTAVGTQTNATWGLDRVDQADLPLNSTYNYGPDGSGVTAYVIDTGIRTTHNDFGGRASSGFDAVDGGAADDCHGHGTHVAGTVGGTTYGVAKGVQLVAVRVLDCAGNGTTAGVIAGIDWVTGHHSGAAVANMSLGGGASASLDDAVRGSIASGVVYALAAGNGNRAGIPQDACGGSPSRVTEGLTVGATTKSDTESSFSNYGTCVDLLAPGSSITSAWYTDNTAANTISGTSMATPHVTGAAALYLDANPGASPGTVADGLVSNTTPNTITLHSRSASGGTPNKLLYTGFMNDGGSEPPPPPTGFVLSATGTKVKGVQQATLTWSGAGSANVDVLRNGTHIGTTANDGSHLDDIGLKGSASYVYQLCETGASTCSNTVTVTF